MLYRLQGTPVNFAAYLGQQWYLAIGDSLYVLSTQPLVTLSITVQGEGRSRSPRTERAAAARARSSTRQAPNSA